MTRPVEARFCSSTVEPDERFKRRAGMVTIPFAWLYCTVLNRCKYLGTILLLLGDRVNEDSKTDRVNLPYECHPKDRRR